MECSLTHFWVVCYWPLLTHTLFGEVWFVCLFAVQIEVLKLPTFWLHCPTPLKLNQLWHFQVDSTSKQFLWHSMLLNPKEMGQKTLLLTSPDGATFRSVPMDMNLQGYCTVYDTMNRLLARDVMILLPFLQMTSSSLLSHVFVAKLTHMQCFCSL